MLGILATFPATIITAIASPIALPTPKTTADAIPLFAAGTTTLKMVSILFAPKAKLPNSYSTGTASMAVIETLIIDGKIITAKTIIAENKEEPSGILNNICTQGTKTNIPIKP